MSGTRRTERVSKEMLRLMGGFLLELRDARLAAAMVTPTRARISPDMSVLDVWVSIQGPEALQLELLEVLGRARPYLRRRVGEEGGLRITPQVRFFRDETPDHAARIAELLEEVRAERPAGSEDGPAANLQDADDDELAPAEALDGDAEDDEEGRSPGRGGDSEVEDGEEVEAEDERTGRPTNLRADAVDRDADGPPSRSRPGRPRD